VLPAGAGAEVGGEPTAATDTNAGAGAAVEVRRWGRGGTQSGTSEEHYWIEQSQLSSSWFPCGHGHNVVDELWKCPSSVEHHALLSLVERPIMKRSFFFSSVSTWSGAYCTRWLNCLE
jgi:hypothetical protein